MESILVVEDEPDVLELIRYTLGKAGYRVEGVKSGEAALNYVTHSTPQLIVLDLMLPGIDGQEVCRQLKKDEHRRAIPVVMLTARTEDSDIVAGLEAGADDYVTKPFNPKVLVARVRAALRRPSNTGDSQQTEEILSVHGITIDVARHSVLSHGTEVTLSHTEFAILEVLARNPGKVFSRTRIIDAIRGQDYPVTERSVDVQIVGLRKKLGNTGNVIETVRGVGYRMQEE